MTPCFVYAAPTGGAEKSGCMGVVHHNHGVVLVGKVADAHEVGLVALHGEDAVGGDHAEAGVLRLLQLVFQVRHVVVPVDLASGFAEPDAVDDARVVQGRR